MPTKTTVPRATVKRSKIAAQSIVTMPICELTPAQYNPRSITTVQREALRKSLLRFGNVLPVVWNKRTKTLIGGHQRLSILQELGETETQVVVVDLPLGREKALNIALNSPTVAGDFTDDLAVLLEEIRHTDEALYHELDFSFFESINWEEAETPESVQANVEKLNDLKAQRAHGNDAVVSKTDTERYLVIVCANRAEREALVESLGLPKDERYVARHLVTLRAATPAPLKPSGKEAAPAKKAGATG